MESTNLQQTLDGDLAAEDRLRTLYAWIDERCTAVADRAVCAPGCAFCCRGPVQITEAEAHLISLFAGRGFTSNAQAASSPFSSLCPLLDADTKMCTVHDVRPMACRTRFAFDNASFCAKGSIHQTYDLAHFADENDAELGSARLRKVVLELSGGMRADIRFFFG